MSSQYSKLINYLGASPRGIDFPKMKHRYVRAGQQNRELNPLVRLKLGTAILLVTASLALGTGERESVRLDDQEVAKPEIGKAWTVPGLEIEFVSIEPGEFLMGSFDGELDEQPPRTVILSQPFWIGKHEIAQGPFEALMRRNTSKFRDPEYPMDSISWYLATEFCFVLTRQERKAGRIPPGYCYRLPTEAEWEYCCRAGTTSRYSFGNADDLLHRFGNYCDATNSSHLPWIDRSHSDGFDRTAPIGSFNANPWGIYDMHGNVWEWCFDFFYAYNKIETTNPFGVLSGVKKVLRGGSWYHAAIGCSSSNRDGVAPEERDVDFGFRAVLAQHLIRKSGGD